MRKIFNRRFFYFLLAFIPVIAVVIGLLFHEPIFFSVFEWYAKRTCNKCFGGDLTAERIYREDGRWIMDNPRILKEMQGEGPQFQAKRLEVRYAPNIWNRQVDLDITLVDPHFEFADQGLSRGGWLPFLESKSSFITIHGSLTVDNGLLTFNDSSPNSSLKHTISFDSKVRFAQMLQAEGTFHFGDKSSQAKQLKVELLEKQNNQLKCEIQCHQADLAALTQTIGFFNHPPHSWLITQGTLDGSLSLIYSENEKPYMEGALNISDLAFIYPSLDVKGTVSEAKFALNQENQSEESKKPLGTLEITKGASIEFLNGDSVLCKVQNLLGGIYLDSPDNARVELDGLYSYLGQTQSLHLEGLADFSENSHAFLDLALRLASSKRENVSTHFVARKLDIQKAFAEIEIKNFTQEEFHLLQTLMGKHFPEWNQFHVHSGSLDASMMAYLDSSQIKELKIEKIAARNLELAVQPWNLYCKASAANGNLAIDPTNPNILETLDSSVAITDGQLSFLKPGHQGWGFTDIQAMLSIKQGVLQKTQIKGGFAGLQGSIDLDWSSTKEAMKLNFVGGTHDIALLLPQNIGRGINKKFDEDLIKIEAGVKRTPNGLNVAGLMEFAPRDYKGPAREAERIAFGFDLEKSSENLWGKWPPPDLIASYWQDTAVEAMRAFLPPLASPIITFNDQWMKRELGIAGLVLRNGWFNAHELPVEKYVTPFIFRDDQLKLSGKGDFKGGFDNQSIWAKYDARDLVLENDDLTMEVKSISGLEQPHESRYVAEHFFDFNTGQHYGFMPIRNGIYKEKNSGLSFTDVNAFVAFEGEQVHIPEIETYSCGVYFAGAIDVDYSNPVKGYFDVEIRSHTMHGKVSEVQNLFSHFKKPFFFLKFPIEGNLAFRKDGGMIRFEFKPEDYDVHTKIQGTLTDGTMHCQNADVALHELSMNFEYDHDANTLDFADIQGTLLVGKPDHVEEYSLAGDHVRFVDYVHNKGEFDVWVGDKKRDVLRLVGKTIPVTSKTDGEYVEFILNHDLTHFGDVHPSKFHLIMKNWSEIDTFRLDLDFSLSTLLHDLQRFSRTGLFFLSRGLLKEINDIKTAGGEFKLELQYDDKATLFTYNATGEDVAIGSHQFQRCLLSGKKKDRTWAIDQLQLDDLSFAADILRTENSWKFNFLGIRGGQSFLMGLEGEYLEGRNDFDAKVNLLEVNLEHLDEWNGLKEFTNEFLPKGELRATGQMHLDVSEGPSKWRWEAVLNASLSDWEIKGLVFQDAENASWHITSERGMTFRQINSSLLTGLKGTPLANLKLDKADYDFTNKEFLLEGLHFNASANNLEQISAKLQKAFPEAVNPKVAAIVRGSKKLGNLEGSFNLEAAPSRHSFHLSLKEGNYHFLDKDHNLSNFILDYSPLEFKMLTLYRFQRHQFWLMMRSNASDLDHGELFLSDYHPDKQPSHGYVQPLSVSWKIDPQYGFWIQKADGHLAGIEAHLVHDQQAPMDKESINLAGEIKVDMHKAGVLLSEEMAKKAESWQIGSGYSLKGKWAWRSGAANDPLGAIGFQGLLSGTDYEFKGYQFREMSAQVDYKPGSLHIGNMRVNDMAGIFQIDNAHVTKHPLGHWQIDIPAIIINDLRPSFLRNAGTPPPHAGKPLIVQQVDIQGVQGVLGEELSLTGNGKLSFLNPKKKNIQNPLFAIPAEILTRIGLDLSVLNPVTGTIFFEINNGKIHLTKFKDMYSEGKMSKFYLADTSTPSYVDFNGNLYMQVRMKQYNLVFKLAELFTVTIQGTLKKPTYSLQKQVPDDPPISE